MLPVVIENCGHKMVHAPHVFQVVHPVALTMVTTISCPGLKVMKPIVVPKEE